MAYAKEVRELMTRKKRLGGIGLITGEEENAMKEYVRFDRSKEE